MDCFSYPPPELKLQFSVLKDSIEPCCCGMDKLDGPWIKTPLSQTFGIGAWNLYKGGICAKLQVNLLECMEAYGYDKGLKYCNGFLDDYYECRLRRKQMKRRDAMEAERKRQYWKGQIKDRYVPPPDADTY